VDPPPGLEPPVLTGPLDLEVRLAALPAGTQARGFLFSQAAEYFGLEDGPRYLPYRNYPAEDYLRLIAREAGDLDPKRKLYELGRRLFAGVAVTAAGRVALALSGGEPATLIAQVERSLRVVSIQGKARVLDRGTNHAHYVMNDIHSFPSLICGCVVGAFEALGVTPRLVQRSHSLSQNEHYVTWS